jgi:hypothetical protein
MNDETAFPGLTANVESTTWRCLECVPEGPFEDGEIMLHFEMELLETGERYLVSVSGPGNGPGANFGRAMVGAAGILAKAVGGTMPTVAVNTTGSNRLN